MIKTVLMTWLFVIVFIMGICIYDRIKHEIKDMINTRSERRMLKEIEKSNG